MRQIRQQNPANNASTAPRAGQDHTSGRRHSRGRSSGKIVELAVRDVIHDRSVRNRDALANPQALEHFRNRPELSV